VATRPGDTCPKCGKGRIRTRSSHPLSEDRQVRYLECQVCDYKTKTVVLADHIWRRSFVPYKQV
jgi:DNA-directed RNA polymerase subunit M/transcription elongation factor TFIIS